MAEAVGLVTKWLRLPGSHAQLLPIQVRCLTEAFNYRRLIALVGAGGGKTNISFLLPTVLDVERTLLLLPAKLIRKTHADHDYWSQHFRMPPLWSADDTIPTSGPVMRVLSYESLSRVNFSSFLDEYEPQLLICDEAHRISRMSSGRTKRLFRYVKTARKAGRDVIVVPMTGTVWRKRVSEAATLFECALQDQSTLPTDYPNLEGWGYCLDEGVREDVRYSPGALRRLCPEDDPSLDEVRRGVRHRLLSCPGIVATAEGETVPIPLTLQARPIQVPDVVREAMAKLKTDYQLPNGDDAGDGVQVWAHAREIGCGFSYRFDPVPPKPWTEARRAWNGFVRAKIDWPGKGTPCDTPLQVWQGVEAGRWGTVPEYVAWQAIKDSFRPKTACDWLSDFLVKDAEEWALANDGLVWIPHATAYAEAGLDPEADTEAAGRAFTRIPFFGAGDNRIEKHRGACAASMRSHGEGKNLTAWDKALFLMPPSSGATMEQVLARLHRKGQLSDQVEYFFYAHTIEAVRALATAQSDARFMESMSGNPQRILTSTILDADDGVFDPHRYLEAQDPQDPLWSPPGRRQSVDPRSVLENA